MKVTFVKGIEKTEVTLQNGDVTEVIKKFNDFDKLNDLEFGCSFFPNAHKITLLKDRFLLFEFGAFEENRQYEFWYFGSRNIFSMVDLQHNRKLDLECIGEMEVYFNNLFAENSKEYDEYSGLKYYGDKAVRQALSMNLVDADIQKLFDNDAFPLNCSFELYYEKEELSIDACSTIYSETITKAIEVLEDDEFWNFSDSLNEDYYDDEY